MSYNRPDLAVKVNVITTKGYTMGQIGDLDNRISRLEYYTVLQALETGAQTRSYANNMTGIQRFKTGIFADPFNDFTLADTGDPEFRIAIDSSIGQLRPLFTESFNKFTLVASQSSGYAIHGRLATLSYDEEKIEANPLASNYRSPIESFYDFVGTVSLFPNFDNAVSQTNAAPQNVSVDAYSGIAGLVNSGAINTQQDISKVAAQPVLTSSTSTTNYWSQTTTTTTTDLTVSSQSQQTDLGNLVTNVSLLPFASQNIIGGIISGIRPNTRVYPFFDTVAVSQYVAPATLGSAYVDANGNLIYSNLNTLTSQLFIKNGNNGDPIVSNQYGKAYFLFYLPANTFRTGTKTFFVSNRPDYSVPSSSLITQASGTYTATSLSIQQKDVSFTVLEPSVGTTTSTSSTTSNYTTAIPQPTNNTGGVPGGNNSGNHNGGNNTNTDPNLVPAPGYGDTLMDINPNSPTYGTIFNSDGTVNTADTQTSDQQQQETIDPNNVPTPPIRDDTEQTTTQEAGDPSSNADGSSSDHDVG